MCQGGLWLGNGTFITFFSTFKWTGFLLNDHCLHGCFQWLTFKKIQFTLYSLITLILLGIELLNHVITLHLKQHLVTSFLTLLIDINWVRINRAMCSWSWFRHIRDLCTRSLCCLFVPFLLLASGDQDGTMPGMTLWWTRCNFLLSIKMQLMHKPYVPLPWIFIHLRLCPLPLLLCLLRLCRWITEIMIGYGSMMCVDCASIDSSDSRCYCWWL